MAGMKSKRMHLGVLLGLLGAAVWVSRGPEGGETVGERERVGLKEGLRDVVKERVTVDRKSVV
jgi:hypothetical protein